ncbi:MAG: hypothetical protein JXJ30_06055 [Halothiobacillaceae bacterium]|nr:hypothetical protein [Halothiobacillaceae bacterium]
MTERRLLLAAAAVLVCFGLLLAGLAVTLPTAHAERLFSEEGVFERLSYWLWIGLAVAVLFARPIALTRRVGMAVIALALAAREEGWHKKFTADSLFKSDYYQMTDVPIAEKVVAGAVVLALTALLLWLLAIGGRRLFWEGGWRRPWGWVTLFGVFLSPVLKVFDRAPSILSHRFDIVLPNASDMLLQAFEEGFEMALPVIFLFALVLFLREPQRPR